MSDYNWADLHKDATTTLEGEFPVVCVEAVATKTGNGDKDMIKCKFKVETGQYAGRPLWNNFTVSPESPAAMHILFSHFAIFGIDSAFFAANPKAPTALIAETLVGRRAVAVVGTRQWQGADREDIKEWKPALGGHGGGASTAAQAAAVPVAAAVPAAAAVAVEVVTPATPPPADPFA